MVYSRYFESDNKFISLFSKLKYFFNFKNVVFIIFSFIASSQLFECGYPIFSVAIFGVASVFNVPLLLVGVFSGLGLFITSITSASIFKFLAIFTCFIFVTSLINIEGLSKKYATLLKLEISILIVEIIANLICGTLFLNMFNIFQAMLFTAIFYMLFVPASYVIINFKNGFAYSKEETISSVIMLCLLTSIFSKIQIYNISIMNVILFLIILIYGWKTSAVSGIVAGFCSGLLLTLVLNLDIVTIIMLGISGLVSGLLSKFGKLGIIIGFVVGNIYIIFYASGFSQITIRLSELIIASTALLVLPKKLEKKIDNIFDLNIALAKPYENMLDCATETKNKINAMSNIFEDLANISVVSNETERLELKKILKRYILDYVECSCIDCKIKKQCKNKDRIDLISTRIVEKFELNEKIDKTIFDDIDCSKKEELIAGLEEVYRNIKVMNFLKKKEIEDSNKMANKYKEMASILRNVSKNIKAAILVKDDTQLNLRNELKLNGYFVYEDEYSCENGNFEYTFVTNILTSIDKQKKELISIFEQITGKKIAIKLILNSSKTEKSKIKVVSIPLYDLMTSVISHNKDGNDVSGDSYLIYELNDKKQAVLISDGVSNSKEAKEASSLVIRTLENLLSNGFEAEKSIEIVNSVLALNNESRYATLDMAVFDLNTCDLNLIKIGAAPTYILDEASKVTVVSLDNTPLGLNQSENILKISHKLSNEAIVVQITDGAINSEFDINNNFITTYLKSVDSKRNVKQIADDINKLVVKSKNNVLDDDITIIVTKIVKND